MRGLWNFRWIPLLSRGFTSFPDIFLRVFFPSVSPNLDVNKRLIAQIDQLTRNPDMMGNIGHDIVFTNLIPRDDETSSSKSPSKESLLFEVGNFSYSISSQKAHARMEQARVIVVAGSDTVANTCSTGLFFALNNPSIKGKLQAELDEAWPDKESEISLQRLEQLPYLVRPIHPFIIHSAVGLNASL